MLCPGSCNKYSVPFYSTTIRRVSDVEIDSEGTLSTVKPVLKDTCIKQSSLLKGRNFRSHKSKIKKFKLTCIKQVPVLGNQFVFPLGVCLTPI